MILKSRFSKLVKEAIRHIHGRQYIDHFWHLKANPESMKPLLVSEEERTSKFFAIPEVKKLYEDYYHTSYQRKDTRTGDLPEMIDDYEYQGTFATFNTSNDYQIIVRKNSKKESQTILDLKTIPFLHRYQSTLKLTKMKISDDHSIIGFGIDLLNNEDQVWMFKYCDDDELLKVKLYECFDAKFTRNNDIIYTEYDDKFRPFRVKLHKLGTNQDDDQILYEELDEQYYLDLQQSKDKEYLIVSSSSKLDNEVRTINRTTLEMKLIHSRSQKSISHLHHHPSGFYALTNHNAYDFKVLHQKDDKFEDFYTPANGEVIYEVDLFKDHLVLYINVESDNYIRVINLADKSSYLIQIPTSLIYTDHEKNKKGYLRHLFDKYIKQDKSHEFLNKKVENEIIGATIEPGANENFNTSKFVFHLSTPLVYDQAYQYDLKSKTLSRLQDSKLTGKPFAREQYTCSKIYAPSKDGTQIPITLVHSKNLKKNRQNKLLLHSYGAYGIPQEIPFNILYLQALENDWVLGFAHIRGGNERGQAWHKAAVLENKLRSIDDLIACNAHLISTGYTHPALLCGYGASAGATILAAALNMRPDLWKCAVLSSPFLDVLGALLDENLPLTKSDYLEFGNPNENRYFESILTYSPYDNIKEQVYPPIYISAGEDDFRAPLWNVLKYSSKLRLLQKQSLKVNNHELIVDVSQGGHFGSAGVHASIEEKARYMAFLEYYVKYANEEITTENITQKLDDSVILNN